MYVMFVRMLCMRDMYVWMFCMRHRLCMCACYVCLYLCIYVMLGICGLCVHFLCMCVKSLYMFCVYVKLGIFHVMYVCTYAGNVGVHVVHV